MTAPGNLDREKIRKLRARELEQFRGTRDDVTRYVQAYGSLLAELAG